MEIQGRMKRENTLSRGKKGCSIIDYVIGYKVVKEKIKKMKIG